MVALQGVLKVDTCTQSGISIFFFPNWDTRDLSLIYLRPNCVLLNYFSNSVLECMRKHRDAVFSVMSPQKEERTSSQPNGLSGASPLNLGNHIVAVRRMKFLKL